MKLLVAAVLALSAVAAQPVQAGPWRDFRGGPRFNVQDQRQRPGGFIQRQPQRDFRRPDRPPEQGQRPGGRLTDDERRDLHRDLDRANREFYKRRQ